MAKPVSKHRHSKGVYYVFVRDGKYITEHDTISEDITKARLFGEHNTINSRLFTKVKLLIETQAVDTYILL